MAEIIDGNKIGEQIRAEVARGVEELKNSKGVTPGLAVIIAGDDPASKVYVRNKQKACEKLGIYSEEHALPGDVSEEKLLSVIDELNENPKIHGILVQLPLPKQINPDKVLNRVSPEKDVDGFHPINVGKLMVGADTFVPCTPQGIMALLEYTGVEIAGKEAVIVGRSNLVGKPILQLLLQKNATVTVCHSKTNDLSSHTKGADILVAAVGSPQLINGEMVKEGVTIIDVGVNRVDNKLVGDVDFESVKDKAARITPVPGGVGPMTIAMLMKNVLKAAKQSVS